MTESEPARFGDVSLLIKAHVALIEMHRPPHNHFDATLIQDIARACAEADLTPHARAIVLCAEGTSFCAGASFSGDEGSAFAEIHARALYAAAARLFEVATPIVAAVNGAAIGGGLGLALAADFRVVSPETRMAANFVKLGIHPGFGLTLTLPRLIGEQQAALLFLTGRRIDGTTALRLGLADELAPAAQLRAQAIALAQEIAANAPLAVVSTRRTLRQGLADQIRARTEQERIEQAWLMQTTDYREGVAAVAARRPGQFTGIKEGLGAPPPGLP